jgi:hypothetical protein
MLLDEVYFCRKKFDPGALVALQGFAVFAGVFEGGFGKFGVSGWLFCGQRVVKCVAKMDGENRFFEERKFCRFFNFFFAGLEEAI